MLEPRDPSLFGRFGGLGGVVAGRAVVVGSALLAIALGCVATSPAWLALLNWDNGAYIADAAMGRNAYLRVPWSAHFAIGHIYAIGTFIARHLGATVFDGFRIATVLAFALGTAIVADACVRLSRSARVATGIMLGWCTSWVHVFLLLTLEDNLLYLPFLALLFRVAVVRGTALRRRDALLAGAAAGMATLMSLQAMLYLAPAFGLAALATLAREARPRRARALAVALVPLGFAASWLGWCALIAAVSSESYVGLLRILVSLPNPPLGMRGIEHVGGYLAALDATAGYLFGHVGMDDPPTFGLPPFVLGVGFLLAVAALAIAGARRALRDRATTPPLPLLLAAATLLAFTIITPLRVDVDYAYLKRFDFLPTCLAIFVAAWAARSSPASPRAWIAIGLVVASAQLYAGAAWSRSKRASYASLPCPASKVHPHGAWYGRDGRSWIDYFRRIRQEHPDACAYVFDLAELDEARWWLEVPGALWSELPTHVVLGSTRAVADWRYPPRMIDLATPPADPPWRKACAVVSCSAQRRLAFTTSSPR